MLTLLRYDITTNPFPLQASPANGAPVSATITVVVSNPNPETNSVALQGLIIRFPIGSDASDLTLNAPDIVVTPPDGWMVKSPVYDTGSVSFFFSPSDEPYQVGSAGLSFQFTNVLVNSQTGTVEVDVTEGSGGCTPPNCPVQALFVTKFPSGWGQVDFSVDPPIVQYGQGVTLAWSGPAGATYTLDYYLPQTGIVHVPAQGAPPLGNVGQYPGQGQAVLSLTQNTPFTLTVTESIDEVPYSTQQQKMVTVLPPKPTITKFCGTVTTTQDGTMSITFEWATENAVSCMLSFSPEMLVPNSPEGGSQMLVPQPQMSYTLTAFNAANATDTSTLQANWSQTTSIDNLAEPAGVATSSDGSLVYVTSGTNCHMYLTDSAGHLTPAHIFALSSDSNSLPTGIAMSPDGTRLYAVLVGTEFLQGNQSSVQVFSAEGESLGPAYPLGEAGQGSWGIAVSPDGTRLYVLGCYNGYISTFAVSSDDTNPLQPIGTPVPLFTYAADQGGLAMSVDGTTLHAATKGGFLADFTMDSSGCPVDAGGNLVARQTDSIRGLATRQGFPYIAVAVQQQDVSYGILWLLDPSSEDSVEPIEVGPSPTGVALAGLNIYVASQNALKAYAPTTLTGGTGC